MYILDMLKAQFHFPLLSLMNLIYCFYTYDMHSDAERYMLQSICNEHLCVRNKTTYKLSHYKEAVHHNWKAHVLTL